MTATTTSPIKETTTKEATVDAAKDVKTSEPPKETEETKMAASTEETKMKVEESTIKLVSSEGEFSISVPLSIAKMSGLIGNMMDEDDEAEDGCGDIKEIPLDNVKTEILTKTVEFCKHHLAEPMMEIEKPLKSMVMKDVVQDWYASFVEMEQVMLFQMILAADYMDIKPLLDLCCATVASMIKGKTPEEIRAPSPKMIFGLEKVLPDWLLYLLPFRNQGTPVVMNTTPSPSLSVDDLNTIPDDILVATILPFFHFRELKEVLMSRPWLRDMISLEDVVRLDFRELNEVLMIRPWLRDMISLEDVIRSFHNKGGYKIQYEDYWDKIRFDAFFIGKLGRTLHLPSSHRFCRMLGEPEQLCETCGAKQGRFYGWCGLWLCNNCERQICTCKDPEAPQHFSRWIVTSPLPNFTRQTVTLEEAGQVEWGTGFKTYESVEELRDQLYEMRVANYSWLYTGWAAVLAEERYDSITGEPIGPIVTNARWEAALDKGQSVEEFLQSLPAVPDTSGLIALMDELDTVDLLL